MRLNNWSIAASYDTARIFAGLGFGSSTASGSIISRPRRTGLCSGSSLCLYWDGPAVLSGLSAGRRGDSAMARTYREIAIEEMLRTVEEAMSRVIDWWGDLPPEMKEAIEQFRTQLGAAIDSVDFVKRALDRQVPETDRGEGPA